MKFLIDANISYSSLKMFEEIGIDAVHARDAGLMRASDMEIFNYAASNKCVILTKDIEFGNFNFFPLDLSCVVVIVRFPFYFTAYQFSEHLKEILMSVDLKELENSITIIKLGKVRIRKLNG